MFDIRAVFDTLEIDGPAWEARLDGEAIDLTKTEFEILALLASSPGVVVRDETIRRIIWGHDWFGDPNNLAVHVSKLRRKLGEDGRRPRFVRTVRGVGYRFDAGDGAPDTEQPPVPTYGSLRAVDGAVEVHADADLNVVSIRSQSDRVLGFDPADLLGRYFPVVGDAPWTVHESALDGLAVLVSSGVREWTSRHVVRRADGTLCKADFATQIDVEPGGRLREVRFVVVERIRELAGGGGIVEVGTSTSHWHSVSA